MLMIEGVFSQAETSSADAWLTPQACMNPLPLCRDARNGPLRCHCLQVFSKGDEYRTTLEDGTMISGWDTGLAGLKPGDRAVIRCLCTWYIFRANREFLIFTAA